MNTFFENFETIINDNNNSLLIRLNKFKLEITEIINNQENKYNNSIIVTIIKIIAERSVPCSERR